MSFQIIVDPDPQEGLLLPCIQVILSAYAKYERDPSPALGLAGIDAGILQRKVTAVSMAQLMVFAQATMRGLNDEALGWFSRPMPWGSLSMLARSCLTATTLRVALKRWIRHQNILVQDLTAGLQENGNVATIALTENRRDWDSSLARELALITTLRGILGYGCWIIDSSIPIVEARFPFETPLHVTNAPLFDGPVLLGGAQACLSFDSRYLDLPNRRNEEDLQAMLAQEALYLTTYRYRRDRLLVNRVRDLLNDRLGAHSITADTLADILSISTRTLHRQLLEEGTSLQCLKNEVRRKKAEHLLLHTTRPVKQIAQAVGYRNEQGFTRAFSQWTGASPMSFRQRARGIPQTPDSNPP